MTLMLTPYYWHCYTTDYELTADVKVHLDFVHLKDETYPCPSAANPVFHSTETSVRTSPADLSRIDDATREDQLFRIRLGRIPAMPNLVRFPTVGPGEGELEAQLSVTGVLTLSLAQGASGRPAKLETPIDLFVRLPKRFGRTETMFRAHSIGEGAAP